MDNAITVKGSFPGIITPPKIFHTLNHCLDFINNQTDLLQQLLLTHSALLFRGWPIWSARDFSCLIEALALGKFVDYIGGDSPRDKVEGHIYTSTEAPPNFYIPLHQELSFIKKFPRHIYFYCEIAPQRGGETILGNAKKMYTTINPQIRKQFESKGLTYISRYFYKDKLMRYVNKLQRSHKSWIEVFETEEKEIVEHKCQDNEFDWRWLTNNWLEIKQTRPAIFAHPLTQEKVWFNQAHLYDFNPKLLGWKKFLGAKLFYFKKSMRLHEVCYADGSSIKREDLYYILDFLQKHTIAFTWQAGDMLVLDNILAMHGRAPFSGKRRILAAMTS